MMVMALSILLLQAKPVPPRDESVLVRVADHAQLPSLALDSDGNAYIAFIRNGNVELAASMDGGKTFGPPVTALNAGGRAALLANRGPRVTVDRQKRVYVSAPLSLGAGGGSSLNDLY